MPTSRQIIAWAICPKEVPPKSYDDFNDVSCGHPSLLASLFTEIEDKIPFAVPANRQ
jgi:hypothetical protein